MHCRVKLPVVLSIVSAVTFLCTIIAAGITYPEYNHAHQYLSELGAPGSPYAVWVNLLAFITPGALLLVAVLISNTALPPGDRWIALGKYGLAWYACGLMLAGIIPCDENCTLSLSSPMQMIHSFIGWTSYLFGTTSIFLLISHVRKYWIKGPLSHPGFILLGYCAAFSFLMLNLSAPFSGVWQRILEATVFSWAILYTIQFSCSIPTRPDPVDTREPLNKSG